MDASAVQKVEDGELQRKASIKEHEHTESKGERGDTGKSNPKPEEKWDNGDPPPAQSVPAAGGENIKMGIRKEGELCNSDDNDQSSLLVDDEATTLNEGWGGGGGGEQRAGF